MRSTLAAGIDHMIDEIAEQIRTMVHTRRDQWRTVPHLFLATQGRGGWNDELSIICQNNLWPIGREWPPSVFVDCYSGILVDSTLKPSTSRAIVRAYIDNADFDVTQIAASLKNRTHDSRDSDDPWRVRDDAQREEYRRRFNVQPVCANPATPIKWSYSH